MKKRKLIITLFIILIISFIIFTILFVIKNHNDKIKLEEEKRLNKLKEEEKINNLTKKYSVFLNNEKILDNDDISNFFNNIIDIKNAFDLLKINDVTISNIINPKKAINSNDDIIKKIEKLNYPEFKNFDNLSSKENEVLKNIYNESDIIKNKDIYLEKKNNMLLKLNQNNEFLKFLENNQDNYYVNGYDIIYKDDTFANKFKKYSAKYNLLNEKNIGKKVPILMYHAVSDNPWGDSTLFVGIKNFEKQMKYLNDNGFTTLFLSEIENAKNYDKPIIITFDDGYKNIYENAYPILKKYNIKSSFYLITSWLDNDTYISPDIAIEMDASGIIEIGVHTKTHVKLGTISYDMQYKQIIESKKYLEDLLNKKINTIAYPYGSYNTDTINITKENFSYALTVESGYNYLNKLDKYRLKRFKIPRNMDINSFINIVE